MKNPSIAHLRREYRHRALLEKNFSSNPLVIFQRWFQEALKAKVLDANALALTTVSRSGRPSSRMVLLKGLGPGGFVFFTNYQSQKSRELAQKPMTSLLFFWPQLSRQVRVEGRAVKVPARESDAYFKARPRGAQLGAWASHQSAVVPGREFLEQRMKDLEVQYKGKPVPRPPYWGGFRVIPTRIEFWQGRPNRLHDRLVYSKKGRRWARQRLAP